MIVDNFSVKYHAHGPALHVVLNEPASLNALTPAMVDQLLKKLTHWRDDDSLRWIVMTGAGGKAFCAGADVRAMWRHAAAGDYEAIDRYFANEYAIDLLLSEFSKPVIAFVDGLCFGGGMGLAMHSTKCVVTEAASFSMPETLIGFVPDAGATWFLPKLPGALGLYLGLTGARISGPDAVHLGLASDFIPRQHLNTALADVIERGPDGLASFNFPLPPAALEENRARIDRCFGAGSLCEIFASLDADESDWADRTIEILQGRSPTSLSLTFDSLRNPGTTLSECLENERRLVAIAARHPDFQEGIRAALIDKDRSPKWQPTS